MPTQDEATHRTRRRRAAVATLAGSAVLALALSGVSPAFAGQKGGGSDADNSSKASHSSSKHGDHKNDKGKGNGKDKDKDKDKDRIVEVNLVTVNDFHGRIEQSGNAAGIARLAGAVNDIREENANTIFAAAGDMIGASTFTSFIQDDEPTIEALNAAGLDVSSVGNHEFDRGFADLTDRVMPLADWEYLGANVYDKGTTDPALPEYWITEVGKGKDKLTVGFVGAVTDELPSLVSPAGIEDITVGSPVEAANRVADQLSDGKKKNGEADIVVLLVHEGAATTSEASATDPNTRFGQIVLEADANIDAIVSGHTHLAYNHVIDGRPVISSGQYGERFSNMEIAYDTKRDRIVSMENTIYTMATAFNASGSPTAWLAEPDPEVVPIVEEAQAVAAELGGVVLGEAETTFGRAVRANPEGASSFPENRGGESTLGNFVADVQQWALNVDGTRDVQITFMNPGGLRADLAGGEVTYAEAAAVQPFANTLVSLDLTGAQIKSVLEEQWQPAGASRPFLKLGVNSEFTYTYDPQAPQGSHITAMWLDGEPIDPTATYSVGANSFLASGGDNFATLGQGANSSDSGKIDLESMVDWFDEFSVAVPDLAQRAVGVHVAGGATVTAGSTVTVDLSSLDFSRAEPRAEVVEVSVDGAVVGTEPITWAYTENYDEIGQASVAVDVPVGASGETTFDIAVPSTGTTSSFVLTVTP